MSGLHGADTDATYETAGFGAPVRRGERPVIVVVDEADAVFGNRSSDGDSGVSTRIFAAFAAHLGDSSLRGRELWVAMTSRPDLLAIDMKRQGRFGLALPAVETLAAVPFPPTQENIV